MISSPRAYYFSPEGNRRRSPRWRNGEYSSSPSILCSIIWRSRARNWATARRNAGSGNPASTVGGHRQIAALDLVRALRTGLDALQSAGDRELDRLVIAALEMKEFVIAVAAPIAAVDRILAEQVERAGDVSWHHAGP